MRQRLDEDEVVVEEVYEDLGVEEVVVVVEQEVYGDVGEEEEVDEEEVEYVE